MLNLKDNDGTMIMCFLFCFFYDLKLAHTGTYSAICQRERNIIMILVFNKKKDAMIISAAMVREYLHTTQSTLTNVHYQVRSSGSAENSQCERTKHL